MSNQLSPTQERFLPVIVAISLFMQILDATILNTALPTIAQDLNQPILSMQWVVMSYVLTVAILTPISGFIADKYGTRTAFVSAVAIFTVGSILCAMSPNLTMLIMSRMVQGIGGALLVPVAKLVLIKSYPRERLLKLMNYAIVPALVAPVIAPLLGGYLVEWASWHWVFLINMPMGLMGLWVGKSLVPNYTLKNPAMDFAGFFLIATAIACLSFALELVSQTSSDITSVLMAMGLAVVLLTTYYLHAKRLESTNKTPLFSPKLFWVRTFRIGAINGVLTRLGMCAVPFLLPILLQVGLGYSPSQAGWLLTPMAIGAVFSKSVITPIVRTFGYKKSLFINTLLVGMMIMMLSLYNQHTPIWLSVLGLLILGACNSFQFGVMNIISITRLRPHQTSSGNSLLSANQQMSISLSIGLAASLLQFFTPNNADATQIVDAFSQVFLVLGTMTALSGFYFLKLHKKDGMGMYH